MFLRALAMCFALAMSPASVLGWGTDGHEIIADIAAALLSSKVLNASQSAAGDTLSNVANWADQIHPQKQWSWSSGLHFLNVNVSCAVGTTCKYVRTRDCRSFKGAYPFCVPAAVQNYSAQLPSGVHHTSGDALESATRFVVHFMGDLHQPLHCALASDRGGNEIRNIKFDVPNQGSVWDLHQIWDFGMIVRYINDTSGGDQHNFTSELLGDVKGQWAKDAKTWATCDDAGGKLPVSQACPDVWAQETFDAAMLHAYRDTTTGRKVQSGASLSYAYYSANMPVVKKQLAIAGVRLAAVLSEEFGGKLSDDFSEATLPHSGPVPACGGGSACGGGPVWMDV